MFWKIVMLLERICLTKFLESYAFLPFLSICLLIGHLCVDFEKLHQHILNLSRK